LRGRRPGETAAVGLRTGQPVELFPLVEYARCGVADSRRSGRPASASGVEGPGAAHAARPTGARTGDRVRSQLARFFFQAEDGIRGRTVTGVQTCALPISGIGLTDHSLVTIIAKDATTADGLS